MNCAEDMCTINGIIIVLGVKNQRSSTHALKADHDISSNFDSVSIGSQSSTQMNNKIINPRGKVKLSLNTDCGPSRKISWIGLGTQR